MFVSWPFIAVFHIFHSFKALEGKINIKVVSFDIYSSGPDFSKGG